jgi:hypothetical protein
MVLPSDIIPPWMVGRPISRSDGRGFPPGFRIDRIHAPLVRETFLHNGRWSIFLQRDQEGDICGKMMGFAKQIEV